MAWLEEHPVSGRFRLRYRWNGRKLKKCLKTKDRDEAEDIAQSVRSLLKRVERGWLEIPDGVDIVTFALSNGKLTGKPKEPRAKATTLKQLFDKYLESLPDGALETSTLALIKIHKKHLCEHLGSGFTIQNLKLDDLQRYVNKRSAKKTTRGTISAITIKKELTTLSSVWSWALAREIVKHAFPNKGLRFPKTAEKSPFQTWAEIERQIKLGAGEDLWQCLYLTLSEINQVLSFVKKNATTDFVYPMFVFAAHTGARRSEILRSLKRDFDFESRTVLLREKKRTKGKRTFRRVPMTDVLVDVMQDWFSRHPGGPFTISTPLKTRNRIHDDFGPLGVDEATHYFWRSLSAVAVFRGSIFTFVSGDQVERRPDCVRASTWPEKSTGCLFFSGSGPRVAFG